MRQLVIIGAGGFGREVAWLVERINEHKPTWNLRGFIDDNEAIWGSSEGGYPVLGGTQYLMEQNETYVVCAVGSAKTRKKIIEKLQKGNVKFATLVDPSALISPRVEIGEGTIICAGTIVTVDVKIGKHVIINLDCTVGHDDRISDFVTLYPSVNVSGNVVLGEGTELGTGMQVIQGKNIASEVIIGAGSVVVRDIEESGTYVGVPAKRISKKETNEKLGGRVAWYSAALVLPIDREVAA